MLQKISTYATKWEVFLLFFSETCIRIMAFMCSEILTIFNFCSLYTAPQIQD
jgi:hypothetical protein